MLLFRKEASLNEEDRAQLFDSFPGVRLTPDMNARKYWELHLLPPPFADFKTAYQYATRPTSTALSGDSAADASDDSDDDDDDDSDARVKAAYVASRGLLGTVTSATAATAATFGRLRDRLRLHDDTLLPVLRLLASRTRDGCDAARVTQEESGLSLQQLYNYHDLGCIALFEPLAGAYVTLFCSADVDAVQAFLAEKEHPGGLSGAEPEGCATE